MNTPITYLIKKNGGNAYSVNKNEYDFLKEYKYLKTPHMLNKLKKIKLIAKNKGTNVELLLNDILSNYIKENSEETNLEEEMQKLKVKEFVQGAENWELTWDYTTNRIAKSFTKNIRRIGAVYFDKESIDAFFKNNSTLLVREEFFAEIYTKLFIENKKIKDTVEEVEE